MTTSSFYELSDACRADLSGPWCCAYSGGKDSTSLVTWIEYLRRTGQIRVDRPQLVESDTGVEEQALMTITDEMMDLLRASGWECAVVKPKVNEKLYNRILGIGNTPIHPGGTKMRWCTRATKIDPMDRWRAEHSSGLVLTGRRMGESTRRDESIKKHSSCSAGGECGIPDRGENTRDPILHWSMCQVIDWLRGHLPRDVRNVMGDVHKITNRLTDIYGVIVDRSGFDFAEPEVTAGRFGCYGCPAISSTRDSPIATVKRNGVDSPLNELHAVMHAARRPASRCYGSRIGREFGPIKMAVRKELFARVMDIQERSGVVLITPEDEAFIRDCWARKVYPRGWSEEDEHGVKVDDMPLFHIEASNESVSSSENK